jgi:hypothetical protein
MKNVPRFLPLFLLGLAIFSAGFGLFTAWSDYREAVERKRFVFGPDAPKPPLSLVGPLSSDVHQVEMETSYYAAAVFAVAAMALFVVLRVRPAGAPPLT